MTPSAPPPGSPSTLTGLLARAAAHPESGLRFVDRRERASFRPWAELRERALAVAGGLAELGIEPGERVVLVFPTEPAFFDAFLGTLLAGAVPVPLYPPVRLGRLEEYHRRTARMIEAAGGAGGPARLVLAAGRVKRILGETVARARPALGCRTLEELPSGPGFTPPEMPPEALALVQFSSGTTVEPKPVALSHRAVLAQARLLNGFWPDDPENGVVHSGVSWLPLYHDMGLIGCVLPALERPAALTLLPPEAFVARPALWLRTLSRYRGTISPAPNFAYGLCVHKIRDEEMEGVDLSSWYGALNGAEPVAPRVLRAFRDRFARWGLRPEALTPVYGLSEAALAVTFSSLDRPFTSRRFDREALVGRGEAVEAGGGPPGPLHAGEPGSGGTVSGGTEGELQDVELVSVGRPLPGFEVRLTAVTEDGDERPGEGAGDEPASPALDPAQSLPEGRVGRVWVRGPSLMEGYLDRPDLTARALVDGWLDTGDLGFLLGGELYLTGRAKDVVILRGRNHSPAEIEHAVEGVAGLRRGCVVAVSHLPEEGETEHLLLFVEAAVEAAPEERGALPEACSQSVLAATGLAVDRVVVLEPGTLPRTSSGKLRRGETLKRHRAGTLEPPRKVTPLRLAGQLARSGLAYARAGLERRGHDRSASGPESSLSSAPGNEGSAGEDGEDLGGRRTRGSGPRSERPAVASKPPEESSDPLPTSAGRAGPEPSDASPGPPRDRGGNREGGAAREEP